MTTPPWLRFKDTQRSADWLLPEDPPCGEHFDQPGLSRPPAAGEYGPLPHEPGAPAERPGPDGRCDLCRGSLVCGWTLVVLGVVQGLLGDGSPQRGDRLSGSASMFDDLGVRVAALDPHGGWRGGAAQAYEA
ncbi:EspA/EspE family type VII secretion system effector, partial [Mycobacterium marinum]|uniref:EspA/EspE family type VII secretion system effector n=1 Tax=Mycobacterium marinum TaxID=1781 RepID=UPI002359D05A